MRRKIRRLWAWTIAGAMMIGLIGYAPAEMISALPREMEMHLGATQSIDWPLGSAQIQGESITALSSTDESVSKRAGEISLIAKSAGESVVTFNLWGWLPVRTMNVTVSGTRMLVPGGQSIGVAMNTAGVVVVGASDLGATPSPARVAGIKSGDIIKTIDGVNVQSAEHLSSLVTSSTPIQTTVNRDGAQKMFTIIPALDSTGIHYKIGAWVRDSTAGIGTLTYYDPANNTFGALGHAIQDVDTGVILPVSIGEIYQSEVVGVNKGKKGVPGELIGQFFDSETTLGEIRENTACGIRGTGSDGISAALSEKAVPVAARNEIHTGSAQILTTVNDTGVQSYDCQIVRLLNQDEPSTRSMVIKITDPALLEETGGIVQGMSGSPILQDGKIVGAVTHVYINDPTQGYGIYIDWMLTS